MDIFEELLNRIGVNVSWDLIDRTVVSDANILRPVKGHAFEYIFDEVIINLGGQSLHYGGDSDIDRVIVDKNGNEYHAQLKTCSKSTIKNNVEFGVSLHKTHGIEKRPHNLYPMIYPCPTCEHYGEEFPDFLIVEHPNNGIMIIPKNYIPENKKYPKHFADPAIFDWNSMWLNRWDLLGFPEFTGRNLERRNVSPQQKFPRIANIVNLTDEEIVSMWLSPNNFRTLEMNLKGNLREPVFKNFIKSQGINFLNIDEPYPKYDILTTKNKRVQVKGLSKGQTNLNKNIIGVEVMGSHGKGAIRSYNQSDFDYLAIVIEPFYLKEIFNISDNYQFFVVPVTSLPLHYKNNEWGTDDKIYNICKFIIGSDTKGIFITAGYKYRNPVFFRSNEKWYLNNVNILK